MTWRTAVGTIAVVITSIVTAFWLINEPARMAEAKEGFEGRSIEAGAATFENNCTVCHGPQGQGLPGLAPGLNIPEIFDGTRLAEVGWAGSLHDFVYATISGGRPVPSAGTTYPQRMPTWSQEFGGPLRIDQVRDLTNFVLNWGMAYEQGVNPTVSEVATSPVDPVATDLNTPELPTGDAANGEELTTTLGCVACHIQTDVGPAWLADGDPNGEGVGTRAAARIRASDYTGTATTTEQYLRESIVLPDAFVVDGYPPSTMVMTYGETLGKQELANLIAYLLTLK